MEQWIRQAAIVMPDQVIRNGGMQIVDGIIRAVGSKFPVDTGCYHDFHGDSIIPGLIDTHVHGAGGSDIMDGTATSLRTLRAALLQEGTTAFLGTTLSSSFEQLQNVLAVVDSGRKNASPPEQAELLGVHLEGPFLKAEYKGAHDGAFIPPAIPGEAVAWLNQLVYAYPDLIRILTFAVDRADATALLALCQRHGIIPSAGHTAADYEIMADAVAAGIRRLTHTFNAMPGIHHRKPGPVTQGLLNDAVELELIADGVHVHPAILELVFRLKPQDTITLVSDGTRSVGMPDGQYELGGLPTIVKNGIARLTDGTIAGSAYPLLQGVRTTVQVLQRPLPEAVRFASLNPAQSLGVSHRIGSLEVGKEATFVRLDENLAVMQVWVKGILVVDRTH